MMGGPLGAILGASLGNYFDSGFQRVLSDSSMAPGATERVQSVFFTTTFSVMGYIAKADGRVSPSEIQLAESVMAQMNLNSVQREVARNLFNEGKSADFPFHDVIAQFRRECMRRQNLMQMFVEIVVATALADGSIASSEKQLLYVLSENLGFSRAEFESLLGRLGGQAGFQHPRDHAAKLKAAYKLLDITPSSSDQELKKAYRRQMNQHHPDKLVAKGLPEEMMEIANQKTQQIKEAYDLVRQERESG